MLAILFGASAAFWTGAFLGLTLVSLGFDGVLSESVEPLPEAVQASFFALNIVGITVTAVVATWFSTRDREHR